MGTFDMKSGVSGRDGCNVDVCLGGVSVRIEGTGSYSSEIAVGGGGRFRTSSDWRAGEESFEDARDRRL